MAEQGPSTSALVRAGKNAVNLATPEKAKDAATRSPSSVLYQKYADGKLKENSMLSCESKYLQGPFVISSGKPDAQPTCYGLSQCGPSAKGREKTRVACAAEVSGGHFTCPSPEKCLKNGEVLIFGKEITVQ